MHISSTTLSLNVPDVAASGDFARRHFGFTGETVADGVFPLTHPDIALTVIFLRTGLATFRPDSHAGSAGPGLLIALTVVDLDAEFARIAAEGAPVITRPETEPWGERYCQFVDPNGIIWQLVQWMTEPES